MQKTRLVVAWMDCSRKKFEIIFNIIYDIDAQCIVLVFKQNNQLADSNQPRMHVLSHHHVKFRF